MTLELLHRDALIAELDYRSLAQLDELYLLDCVGSTNDYLFTKTPTTKTIACFAEQQTQGKGQQGRRWVSPFGVNIYHSLHWHFDKKPSEIVGLSLVIAIAVSHALKHYGITQGIGLKWPNDVLYQGNKLAGVLIELIADPTTINSCSVIIGIGLNTALTAEQASEINQPWTSIERITSKKVARNQLAGLLLKELLWTLLQFDKEGLTLFLPEWYSLDVLSGKKVTITSFASQEKICGIAQAVSTKGEFVIQDELHQLHSYTGGIKIEKNSK